MMLVLTWIDSISPQQRQYLLLMAMQAPALSFLGYIATDLLRLVLGGATEASRCQKFSTPWMTVMLMVTAMRISLSPIMTMAAAAAGACSRAG